MLFLKGAGRQKRPRGGAKTAQRGPKEAGGARERSLHVAAQGRVIWQVISPLPMPPCSHPAYGDTRPVLERTFPIFNSAWPVVGFTSAWKLGVSHWREQGALNTALLQHRGLLDEPPVLVSCLRLQNPSRQKADEEPVGLQTTPQNKGLCRPGAAPPPPHLCSWPPA